LLIIPRAYRKRLLLNFILQAERKIVRVKKILVFAMRATWLLVVAPFHIPALYAIDFAFETTGGVFTGATHEYACEGDTCISRLDWKDGAIPAPIPEQRSEW
jgi:hypothetical protein